MPRWFTLLLLAALGLPLAGCGLGGESTMDAMKRRAEGVAQANKAREEREKQKAEAAAKIAPPPASADQTAELPARSAEPAAASAPEKTAAKNTSASPPSDVAASVAAESVPVTASGLPPLPVKPESLPPDIERRNQSAKKLARIIAALNEHAKKKGTYPTQSTRSKQNSRPLLSWRVELLPYLGLEGFYKQFKHNEPWDSPHNLSLLPHIPEVFVSPERYDHTTNFLVPHGPGAAFDGIRGKDPLSFLDGAAMTLIVVEADDAAAAPWTQPQDWPIDKQPKKSVGKLRGEGFLGAFGDGYVAFIHNRVSEGQLSWMLSSDGDDFLNDPTIILEATVPDVALVTRDDKPQGQEGPMPAGDPGSTDLPDKTSSPAAERLVGSALPEVIIPTRPKLPPRWPIPPDHELEQARDELRALYESEYRQARSRDERRKVAVKMLADAPRLAEQPPVYYEALRMIRDIAAPLGDVATALKTVELLETKFELPPLELRLATLDELVSAIGESSQSQSQIALEADKVLVSAYEADDYVHALHAHQMLLAMSRKSGAKRNASQLAAAKGIILAAQKAYDAVPPALSTLESNPDHAAANEVAGKYYSLVKDQWEIGLPMLARCTDLKLRILARMDLDADKSPLDKVQLADQYWELATEYQQPQRRGLQLRAVFYYVAAMSELTDGLELVKAEKRIEEVRRNYGTQALEKVVGAGGAIPRRPLVNAKDDSG